MEESKQHTLQHKIIEHNIAKLHQLRPQTAEEYIPLAPPGFHHRTPKASDGTQAQAVSPGPPAARSGRLTPRWETRGRQRLAISQQHHPAPRLQAGRRGDDHWSQGLAMSWDPRHHYKKGRQEEILIGDQD